jgi:hypothetical protein
VFWKEIDRIATAITTDVFDDVTQHPLYISDDVTQYPLYISDDVTQHPLHISAAVVITNRAGLLFWWEVFNAPNCTGGVFV